MQTREWLGPGCCVQRRHPTSRQLQRLEACTSNSHHHASQIAHCTPSTHPPRTKGNDGHQLCPRLKRHLDKAAAPLQHQVQAAALHGAGKSRGGLSSCCR